MAAPHPTRVRPCPICGGPCKRFPDLPTDRRNPFIGGRTEPEPEPPKPRRPKGKRRPAEDRARHLEEDR